MTRDEIIEMAIAASLLDIVDDAYLKRGDWEPYAVRFFSAAYEAGTAAEREACAQACDKVERRKWEVVLHGGAMQGIGARDCAAAIRARGERWISNL
jgi:hypothetical protein